MTLEAVASRQIQASHQQLVKPTLLASYLLDDTFLLLDRQSIEPLHESNMFIASASATVELEAITDISMSNTFCSITSEQLETEIRKIIGHSPDLVSDIVRPITRAIEDLIELVIEPIGKVVDAIKTEVRGGFASISNRIGGAISTIKSGITTVIETSQGIVTDAVKFVEGQVTALLDSVVSVATELFLVVKQVFAELGNVFKDLLSMEPKDIISLQMELTRLAGETIVKATKPST